LITNRRADIKFQFELIWSDFQRQRGSRQSHKLLFHQFKTVVLNFLQNDVAVSPAAIVLLVPSEHFAMLFQV